MPRSRESQGGGAGPKRTRSRSGSGNPKGETVKRGGRGYTVKAPGKGLTQGGERMKDAAKDIADDYEMIGHTIKKWSGYGKKR